MDFAAQSTLRAPQGLHVAIVLDGNGRWAEARRLSRSEGHRAGARAVEPVVAAAPDLGIGTLSLFAFSSANWRRPDAEVEEILEVLREFLATSTDACTSHGVRLAVFGRRDRLPSALVLAIEAAERATCAGTRLLLRLAIDYSAREAIVAAARQFHVELARTGASEGFGRLLEARSGAADVDLLIRTGGERRLSDFLLWECAWAELLFVRRAWPDFDGRALARAVAAFRARERRFGALPQPSGEESVERARRIG